MPTPTPRLLARRLPWLLLLIVIAVVYYACYFRYGINFHDDGATFALNAKRLLEGEVPFRDVELGYNVLWFYPAVGLFKLFGVNFVLLRAYCFALSVLTAVLAFLTLERVSRQAWLAFVVALLLVLVPGMTFKNYMPLLAVANIFCLVHFALGARPRRVAVANEDGTTEEFLEVYGAPSWGWLVAGAIVLGLTFLIRIDVGTFFLLIWLGGEWLLALRPLASAGARAALLIGGPLVTIVLATAVHVPVYLDAQKRGFEKPFVARYEEWPAQLVESLEERLRPAPAGIAPPVAVAAPGENSDADDKATPPAPAALPAPAAQPVPAPTPVDPAAAPAVTKPDASIAPDAGLPKTTPDASAPAPSPALPIPKPNDADGLPNATPAPGPNAPSPAAPPASPNPQNPDSATPPPAKDAPKAEASAAPSCAVADKATPETPAAPAAAAASEAPAAPAPAAPAPAPTETPKSPAPVADAPVPAAPISLAPAPVAPPSPVATEAPVAPVPPAAPSVDLSAPSVAPGGAHAVVPLEKEANWNTHGLRPKTLSDIASSKDLTEQALILLRYAPLFTLVPLALWAILAGLVAWRSNELGLMNRPVAALLVIGGALTIFPQYFFWRSDAPHISEFMPGYWVAAFSATLLLGWSDQRRTSWLARTVGCLFILVLVAHAGLYLWRMLPDRYTGTIAAYATFQKGKDGGWHLHDNRKSLFDGENGVHVLVTKKEYTALEELKSVVTAHAPSPSDYVVAYPYHPQINLLCNRPTYEKNVYVDNATCGRGWNDAAIARIEKYRPAVIVLSDWAINGTDESRFSVWGEKTKTWIQTHYLLQTKLLEFEIYTRPEKEQEPH